MGCASRLLADWLRRASFSLPALCPAIPIASGLALLGNAISIPPRKTGLPIPHEGSFFASRRWSRMARLLLETLHPGSNALLERLRPLCFREILFSA